MLGRLEQNPHSVFTERELTGGFPQEFEEVKRERLIRRVTSPPVIGSTGAYPHPSGRTYVVVPVEGGYEAFDDEDPEVDPVMVDIVDLVKWTVDLGVLAQGIQRSSGLSGKPETLDARLWYLGEKEKGGARAAYVLALLDCGTTAMALLEGLPVRLGAVDHRITVTCPSYQPGLDERRRLDTAGITLVGFDATNSPVISIPDELAAISEVRSNGEEFRYSQDYRWVRHRNREFTLTERQAEAVGILHQAWRGGTPELAWDVIKRRMVDPGERIRDIFKG